MNIIRTLEPGSKKFEESPYTYVRAIVMRTLLIPKEEYAKLMKMSLAEISNYLGETQYKKEISELALEYSGIALIERALNKNFIHTVEKLKMISPPSYADFIDIYLMKYDIENIKTVLRIRLSGIQNDFEGLFIPTGLLNLSKIKALMGKEIDDISKELPSPLKEFLSVYKEINKNDLSFIETKLDHFYFDKLLAFVEAIPEKGIVLKNFLLNRISIHNILVFLKLTRENIPKQDISKYIYQRGNRQFFLKLINAKSNEEVIKIISNSKYRKIKKDIESFLNGGSLVAVEIALQQYMLRNALPFQHQNPLTVYSILSYLIVKEFEMKNINLIIKAKYLGLDAKKIEPHLVLI